MGRHGSVEPPRRALIAAFERPFQWLIRHRRPRWIGPQTITRWDRGKGPSERLAEQSEAMISQWA